MRNDQSASEVKIKFKTREGFWHKIDEFPDESKNGSSAITSTATRAAMMAMPIVDITNEKISSISKMDLNRKDNSKSESDNEQKSLVYCTGKDVYHYLMTSSDSFVDRRSYKGGALPSTLKICQRTATLDTLRVAIGFTAGQLQIIDMATPDDNKRSLQKINDERSIDNASIIVIQWLPKSSNQLLAANQKGNIYLYSTEKQDCTNFSPVQTSHQKIPISFKQFDNEKNGNPEQKWSVGTTPITSLEFNPAGDRLAITSRNGYCLILRNSNAKQFEGKLDLEIDKQVKSYFGGFLCCAWSPSGRFLAVGGEDDLITVMSPDSGKIICRCQGHRSWISAIAWDPFVESASVNIDSRLGSVGQDGILCFWELANDVMFPRRTRTFSESERINSFNMRNGIDPKKEEDQITILEPLIEKRVSPERLTHLSFHEDCFLMASQDKDQLIFKWSRPNSKNDSIDVQL